MIPFQTQAALDNRLALAALDWEMLRVQGPDRLRWLNLLCTQALDPDAVAHGVTGVNTPGRRPSAAQGVELGQATGQSEQAAGQQAETSANWQSQTVSPLDAMFAQTKEALVLDAQGRITHWFLFTDDTASSWLLTGRGQGQRLRDFLVSMRFMFEVDVQVMSDWQVFAGKKECLLDAQEIAQDLADSAERNDEGNATQGEMGFVGWRDPWPGITPGGTTYYEGDKHAGQGFDFVYVGLHQGRAQRFVQGWQQQMRIRHSWPVSSETGELFSESVLAGSNEFEALRIAAWRPLGADVFDAQGKPLKILPHELDLLRTAVHLKKGCYCGQESVARIVNLGMPPRRIVFLQLDGSANLFPPAGSELRDSEGRAVGQLLVSAQHHELGQIALGLVRRTLADDALTVHWEELADEDISTPTVANDAQGSAECLSPADGDIQPRPVPLQRTLNVQVETICAASGVSAAGGARFKRQAVAQAGIPKREGRTSLF